MEKYSFDIPLYDTHEEKLEPIAIERKTVQTMNLERREQRNRLRGREISDRNLVRTVGAIGGAALTAAFTAPAHPIIGGAILAGAGAALADKAYKKLEKID